MAPVPLARRLACLPVALCLCPLSKAYCENRSVVPVSIREPDSSAPTRMTLETLLRGLLPSSADSVIVTNTESLAEISELDESITPVFGIVSPRRQQRLRNIQILGVKDNEVWMSQVDERVVNMARIGNLVDSNDARLERYEESVAGGRLVVAYERSRSKIAKQIEAVVRAASAFYSVKKLDDGAFTIEKIGHTSR